MSIQSFRMIKYITVEALILTMSFMTTLVIFVVSGGRHWEKHCCHDQSSMHHSHWGYGRHSL